MGEAEERPTRVRTLTPDNHVSRRGFTLHVVCGA